MSNLTYLGGVFRWVLQTTWQAAVLAGLILLAQRLLRKRLSPTWRYGLWLLLVVRLLMPVPPRSAVSIFNLARIAPAHTLVEAPLPLPSAAVTTFPASHTPGVTAPVKSSDLADESDVSDSLAMRQSTRRPILIKRAAKINWFSLALYCWLGGVGFFGARLVWTNLRFRSRIGGYQPVAEETATRLFDECRAAFQITGPVRLIESEEVESPAVYGLWRKWLLLPDGVFERFSREELRCIFLHELAHIKRGDLAVNWLVAGLQIFHWFNPLLWLAWARMRADRELATDALALAHVRESDHAPYGETILKVLEGLTGERALPGLVGIVENKAQLKERLAAISRPGKSWKWVALAAAALIAGLGLTGAQTDKSKPEPAVEAKTPRPDSTQADSAPSWRISGTLTDAKTSNPIPRFRITPGVREPLNSSFPFPDRVEGSNGVYVLALSKRLAQPSLKIEADGYLTVAVPVPMRDTTNFALTLQPGSGPAGVVLLPDGKPAANATVGLVCSSQQELLIRQGTIAAKRAQNLLRTTDANGQFSFTPELGMEYVAAASPDGFKLVPLAEIAANPKMILEPWGRITGTLSHPSGPATNEDVDLKFSEKELPDEWALATGCHARTDEKGVFEFDQVPPGKLELTFRHKSGGLGWQNRPIESITMAPGQTLKLDVDTPEPMEPTEITQTRPPLKFGPAISGTVHFPDGKPAAGAQVGLVVPGQPLILGKASLTGGQSGSLRTTTDSDGRFTLPGAEGWEGIIAVHERGFAKIELPGTNSPALVLQPWGEIHGALRISNRVGTNQTVVLRPADFPAGIIYDSRDFTAQTDDQGQFVITYVPPGEQRLTRLIPTANSGRISSTRSAVSVKAGEITEVRLGGSGRQVLGKAEFPEAPPAFAWTEIRMSLGTPAPEDGWSHHPKLIPDYYLPESVTNGSFVFEDVKPGNYRLDVMWMPGSPPARGRLTTARLEPQLLCSQEVTIPDEGNAATGKPFDLGNVELRLAFPPNGFMKASSFEAETIDGRKIHLADYRGKYVLLTAFFTYGKNAGDLPRLKAVFDTFGKDDRLAMLGISYAPAKNLKEFARTNDIGWALGSLGELGNPSSHAEFYTYFPDIPDGMQGQHIFLINPKGEIVARDLHGKEINNTVAEALAGK